MTSFNIGHQSYMEPASAGLDTDLCRRCIRDRMQMVMQEY